MEKTPPNTTPLSEHEISRRRRLIKSFTAKADANRTMSEKVADWLTETFGSMGFLVFNFIFFFTWILVNINALPGIRPFDPFPFGLLTTIVSLEAIALAIFVLISQNRASRVADLREEIDLQIDIMSEREITKILEMQKATLEKMGVDVSQDTDLNEMLQVTNMSRIEKILEKDIEKNHSQW